LSGFAADESDGCNGGACIGRMGSDATQGRDKEVRGRRLRAGAPLTIRVVNDEV
jgi:hypothetical protein